MTEQDDTIKTENPWDIDSIYDFYYFNCPMCLYKHNAKQDFVNHILNIHPESQDYLKKISDGSLSDILTPWDEFDDYGTADDIIRQNLKVELKDDQGNQFITADDYDYYEDPNWDDSEEKSIKIKTEPKHNSDGDVSDSKKGHKCDTCGKSIASAHKLKVHIRTVHEGCKDFECETCGRAFSEAKSLKRHIICVHEGKKNHKCDHCSKSFSGRQSLKKHVENVHQETLPDIKRTKEQHHCNFCGKAFSKEEAMQTHIQNAHEDPRDHTCDTCGKVFTQAHALKKHISLVHRDDKEHICDTCGKSFCEAVTLKKHIFNVHEGHNIFKCEIFGCDASFHELVKLQQHRREAHTKCDHCGKIFDGHSATWRLKRHIKEVHEGLKEHVCEMCGRAFSQKGDMKKHYETVHLKQPKLKTCEICGKTFSAVSLPRHIRQVHEGRGDHVCETCQKAFFAKSDLRRHIDSVHLKKPDVWKHKKRKENALAANNMAACPVPENNDAMLQNINRTPIFPLLQKPL